ncbi:hypothetical protein HNR65_001789 [Desulfosalsimonas propionicica]|jgi:hypothetical protein|uniref:Uncharacterized protein n=1 Tax=Desulfosalsimonas propionicica TaxID=332175 RepID=A0A7W0HKQ4_9BACT|nr:hypothetical protein [Desulfosalsimonas propionicica]MBA2881462.1 hypothetical protein [Desulfosalsimonas propionicica]
MEWMKKMMEASNRSLEMKKDQGVQAKLDRIDRKLKENIQENVEKDRLREQRTLEISRQYFLG